LKWLCLSNIASKAGMAELADAADSKSPKTAHIWAAMQTSHNLWWFQKRRGGVEDAQYMHSLTPAPDATN
jgi:hypothetical protein